MFRRAKANLTDVPRNPKVQLPQPWVISIAGGHLGAAVRHSVVPEGWWAPGSWIIGVGVWRPSESNISPHVTARTNYDLVYFEPRSTCCELNVSHPGVPKGS